MWHRRTVYTFPALCFARKLCMVLRAGSFMCYIPSICQVLDSYPKYSIWECNYTYTSWQQSTLSWPRVEKVGSQRNKSRCSWVWHPQFRILDGKTSFGSVPGLLSTCSCQPSHFLTKDSGICLLCWAERTPPRAAGEMALHHGREIFALLQGARRGGSPCCWEQVWNESRCDCSCSSFTKSGLV